jgi:hypothetical protein
MTSLDLYFQTDKQEHLARMRDASGRRDAAEATRSRLQERRALGAEPVPTSRRWWALVAGPYRRGFGCRWPK